MPGQQERIAPETKRCLRCEQVKPIADFGPDKRHFDGHNSQCRQCLAEGQRQRQSRHTTEHGLRLAQHPETKVCTGCLQEKPADAYTINRSKPLGREEQCKECWAEQRRRNRDRINVWNQKYAAKYPQIVRKKHLMRRYGLPLEEYEALLAQQQNKCANPNCSHVWHPGDKPLYVDHDHYTGAVRGLLCPPCNWILGTAKSPTHPEGDDPAVLLGLVAYLRKDQEQD